MLATVVSIFSLLLGIAVLLVGSGLLGTLVALRAGIEGFPDPVIGVVMSAYFVGFVVGTFLCPRIIRRVGHIRSFSPPRVTLTLNAPSRFGDRVSFSPLTGFSPFGKNKIAAELIERLEAKPARRGRPGTQAIKAPEYVFRARAPLRAGKTVAASASLLIGRLMDRTK